jgi:hypothetical protein
MASKATPSETRALWARAAQARRVAGMLSPRDARLAEAYAIECEDQAERLLSLASDLRVRPLYGLPLNQPLDHCSEKFRQAE